MDKVAAVMKEVEEEHQKVRQSLESQLREAKNRLKDAERQLEMCRNERKIEKEERESSMNNVKSLLELCRGEKEEQASVIKRLSEKLKNAEGCASEERAAKEEAQRDQKVAEETVKRLREFLLTSAAKMQQEASSTLQAAEEQLMLGTSLVTVMDARLLGDQITGSTFVEGMRFLSTH